MGFPSSWPHSILIFFIKLYCVPGISGLGQKYAFNKNPQFLPYHYEISTKEGTHEGLILTKFRNDQIKIVDFLIKAYF